MRKKDARDYRWTRRRRPKQPRHGRETRGEDGPLYQSMRRRYAGYAGPEGVLIRPIIRLMEKSSGQPWDLVYAKIVELVHDDYNTLSEVNWYIHHCVSGTWRTPNTYNVHRSGLYVEDGILIWRQPNYKKLRNLT